LKRQLTKYNYGIWDLVGLITSLHQTQVNYKVH